MQENRTVPQLYGKYDMLYAARNMMILWGSNPGRLVKRIFDFCASGTVLDVGCGDGKNALFLETNGFKVTGIDYSLHALSGLFNRFQATRRYPKGKYYLRDVCDNIDINQNAYNVLLSYGLFHCLPVSTRIEVHLRLQHSVRVNGLVLFTCLLDDLPIPRGHGTVDLELAQQEEINRLFRDWKIEYYERGEIIEHHIPIIGQHHHSAVWLIARRMRSDKRLIVVTGCSGSGKTVLSHRCADLLNYKSINIGDELNVWLEEHGQSITDRTSIGQMFFRNWSVKDYLHILTHIAQPGVILDGIRLVAGLQYLRKLYPNLIHAHLLLSKEASVIKMRSTDNLYTEEIGILEQLADIRIEWEESTQGIDKKVEIIVKALAINKDVKQLLSRSSQMSLPC